MTTRYDQPRAVARAGNEVIRRLAEAGVSVAGTSALRVRGRRTGKLRGVVVNVLTVDGRRYLISPRGNTEWVRNARAAGVVQLGPSWRSRDYPLSRCPTKRNPHCCRSICGGGTGRSRATSGLTPQSTEGELQRVAPTIPVFELQA